MVNPENIINVEIVTMICTVVATVTAVVISVYRMSKPFKEEIRESLNNIYVKMNGFVEQLNETKVDLASLKSEHEILKPRHSILIQHCPTCSILRKSSWNPAEEETGD